MGNIHKRTWLPFHSRFNVLSKGSTAKLKILSVSYVARNTPAIPTKHSKAKSLPSCTKLVLPDVHGKLLFYLPTVQQQKMHPPLDPPCPPTWVARSVLNDC